MKTTLSDQLGTRSPGKIIAIGGWSRRTAPADGGIAVIDCAVPRPWARVGSKMDHRAAHGVVKAPIPFAAGGMTLYARCCDFIVLHPKRAFRPLVRSDRLSPVKNMSAFLFVTCCRVRGEILLSGTGGRDVSRVAEISIRSQIWLNFFQIYLREIYEKRNFEILISEKPIIVFKDYNTDCAQFDFFFFIFCRTPPRKNSSRSLIVRRHRNLYCLHSDVAVTAESVKLGWRARQEG